MVLNYNRMPMRGSNTNVDIGPPVVTYAFMVDGVKGGGLSKAFYPASQ